MQLPLTITTKALHGAFVVLVLAVATAAGGSRWSADDAVLTSSSSGTFQIKGQVEGLYAGTTVPLRLTVVNRNTFKLAVKTVTVTVANASPECVASQLTVTRYGGRLVVPARRSKQLVLQATLAAGAPDACTGASFPLRYRGTAVKA